jgi:hypothetical protein
MRRDTGDDIATYNEYCVIDGRAVDPVTGTCLSGHSVADRKAWLEEGTEPGPVQPNGWVYIETSRRSFCVRGDLLPGQPWGDDETVYRMEPIDLAYPWTFHACPIQAFFDDPITKAYGLGGDWDEWSRVVKCPVCEGMD